MTIYVGTLSEAEHKRVETALPDVTVFESGLEWLQPQDAAEVVGIGKLLLADQETLMVSSSILKMAPRRRTSRAMSSTMGCWCSPGGSLQRGLGITGCGRRTSSR